MSEQKLSFPFLKTPSDLSNIIHQDPIDLKSNEGNAKHLLSRIEFLCQLLHVLWLLFRITGFVVSLESDFFTYFSSSSLAAIPIFSRVYGFLMYSPAPNFWVASTSSVFTYPLAMIAF